MTDDTDILVEVNAIHLTQRTRTTDGLQNTHRHRYLHVSLYGTGGVLLDEHGEGRNEHRV